ncbi:MAG: hypothetical protein WAT37_03840 [Saprospiraceae bacterium]
MLKPTSNIISAILAFVQNEPQVNKLLQERNNHDRTYCRSIVCSFHKQNSTNPAKAAYTVEFIYEVRDPKLETKDDVTLMVEVTDGTPFSFKIISGPTVY